MADECIFSKMISGLIREETGRMMEELRPVIREMIAEEFERRNLSSGSASVPEAPPDSSGLHEPNPPEIQGSEDPLIPADSPEPPDEPGGLYIYGIIDSPDSIRLGDIGIDGATTYTIPYRDISAIVHACPAEPYQSEDTDTVNAWVASHQEVLDMAADRFDPVLPFGFDTIITSTPTETAREVFQTWIAGEYDRLRTTLDKIRGKKEYGVQVFYHPSGMSERVLAGSDLIRSLQKEMETKGPGVAYMYRKKIEQAVEQEMASVVDADFNIIFGQIGRVSDDTRVEKVKRSGDKDKVMMMNISCLVAEGQYPGLGDLLEKIDTMKEYSVRFTGPWPPYSFV